MLSPESLHLRERRGLRRTALATALLTGALLAAGCDRQPKPDTSAMNDPALTGASGVDPVTGRLPGSGEDRSTTIAEAGPTPPTSSSTGAAPGTGFPTGSDTQAVPGSAGTTAGMSGSTDLPPTSAGKPGTAAAALDAADRAFLEKAAVDGQFEIEAGKLAAHQGKHEAVKAYGAMLSSDHGSAASQLRTLAANKGVTVPDALPADKQTALDTLGRAGTNFDHEFVRTVGIRAHQDAVALFEKASTESKDPDVKAFAAKTLPTLKAHLEAARKLPAGKS